MKYIFGGIIKLELRHISCGYGDANPILSDCNFSVSSGEICCLLGPNGVGKTTLFRTILQLQRPLAGVVCIDGQNIAGWSPRKLSEHLAYVPQLHSPMFSYKVRDVVTMGRIGKLGYFSSPTHNDEEIVDVSLEQLDLTDFADRPYTELSGGERQLVLIARALAQQPAFLVLDEPTSGLDYRNSLMILKTLVGLSKRGLGIIMTTHSPDHAFLCRSNVVLLSRSRSLLFGSAADVVTERNLYEAFQMPIRVAEFCDDDNQIVHLCAPKM